MSEGHILIEEFIRHALIMEQTQYSGEYKKGNKSHNIHLSIRDKLKHDSELTIEVFDELLLNDNPYVLYAACVYTIVLNYRRSDAINILKKIADMNYKLTSLHAETALELVETGELFELHGVSNPM